MLCCTCCPNTSSDNFVEQHSFPKCHARVICPVILGGTLRTAIAASRFEIPASEPSPVATSPPQAVASHTDSSGSAPSNSPAMNPASKPSPHPVVSTTEIGSEGMCSTR